MEAKHRGVKHAWTVAALGAVLAGCAGTPRVDGFPDPSKARFAGGSYPNADNVLSLAPGMSKDHLYQLVGPPHFDEGVFGVREWNYLFNFKRHEGGMIACQLKVSFDDNERANAFDWSPGICAPDGGLREILFGTITASGHEVVTERIAILSADASFAFDSDRITPLGQRALDEALERMGNPVSLDRIDIVGHADRIGGEAYNEELSLRRAQAVRDYLQSKGVPARTMAVEGRGSREPVVECDQADRQALRTCLAPNRRVELLTRRSVAQFDSN
jgi:OOP family OmpA-OmpF porin